MRLVAHLGIFRDEVNLVEQYEVCKGKLLHSLVHITSWLVLLQMLHRQLQSHGHHIIMQITVCRHTTQNVRMLTDECMYVCVCVHA